MRVGRDERAWRMNNGSQAASCHPALSDESNGPLGFGLHAFTRGIDLYLCLNGMIGKELDGREIARFLRFLGCKMIHVVQARLDDCFGLVHYWSGHLWLATSGVEKFCSCRSSTFDLENSAFPHVPGAQIALLTWCCI